MIQQTGIELRQKHVDLEREAATILGYMLFEYSRLEMDLGLLIAWKENGQDLDSLTRKLETENFNAKLASLDKSIRSKFANMVHAAESYATWIEQAHKLRELRNRFFHGRWGVNSTAQTISCVVGLPTSPDQQEHAYSIDDLKSALDSLRMLRADLQKLRGTWPL